MPFRNARLYTGTLPDSNKPDPHFKVYLVGEVLGSGVRSWSAIWKFPRMGKNAKVAKEFKTRDEAIRNALRIFPDASSFQHYVESSESRNGMPLSSDIEQRLHLEEVRFPTVGDDASPAMPDEDPNDELFIQEAEELLIGAEGVAFYSWHRRRERDRNLRKKVLALRGRDCEICCMTFRATYGASVSEFAEVHHLSSLNEGERISTIDDFAVLCANCHRAVHYNSVKPRSLQDIRNMMARPR